MKLDVWALAVFLALFGMFQCPASFADGILCPLQNPAYDALQAAATKLLTVVQLPPGCEAQQKEMAQQAQAIAGNLNQLSQVGGTNVSDPAQQARVGAAAQGLSGLNSAFQHLSGKCGGAATSWFEAILDSVDSLTPFLILYGGGGATTWLGVDLLASTVQSYLAMRRLSTFDMSKQELRDGFIRNSCDYYSLNENIHAIINAKEGEAPVIDGQVAQAQKDLADLKAAEPPRAQALKWVAHIKTQQDNDQAAFQGLLALSGDGADPQLACFSVQDQIAGATATHTALPFTAIADLKTLIEDPTFQRAQPAFESQHLIAFLESLDRPELYNYDPQKPQTCLANVRSWVSASQKILDQINQELAQAGRLDLTATPEYKTHAAWESKLADQNKKVTELTARQTFVHELLARGANIEMSEVTNKQDQIHQALFDNSIGGNWLSTPIPGPAPEWLSYKGNQAESALKHFNERARTVVAEAQSQLSDPKQWCGFANETLIAWRTAEFHAQATALYCSTFLEDIEPFTDYKVGHYCQGRLDRNSGKVVSKSRLEGLLKRLTETRPEFDLIAQLMEQQHCETAVRAN